MFLEVRKFLSKQAQRVVVAEWRCCVGFSRLGLRSDILSTLSTVGFRRYAPMRRRAVPIVLRKGSLVNITRANAKGATTCLLPILGRLDGKNCPRSTVGYVVVSPAHRLTVRVSRRVRNFSCFVPISDITICKKGSNVHFRRRGGKLALKTSIIVTAPKHLVDRLDLNCISLSGMSFFVLSRTSHVLSVKFSSSVVRVIGCLPGRQRAVVFSTAVPAGVRRLTGAVLRSPIRIGLTMSGPTRGVVRTTCVYCRTRGLNVVRSLFRSRRPRHIVVFTSSGLGIGRIAGTLGHVGLGINRVRSSLRRDRHRRVVRRFHGHHVSVLITASVITHNVSVSSVHLIVGCSIPRSDRSCMRHVKHATHTGGSKYTVAFIDRARRAHFGRVRAFLKGSVCGLPMPRRLNRNPMCTPHASEGRKNGRIGGFSHGGGNK